MVSEGALREGAPGACLREGRTGGALALGFFDYEFALVNEGFERGVARVVTKAGQAAQLTLELAPDGDQLVVPFQALPLP